MVDSVLGKNVHRYLSKTRGTYKRLLDSIVGEIEDYRDRASARDMIYRIYTRADKQQGGDPLKSEKKIESKIRNWQREEKTDRVWRVYDVHDIIGLTVVAYFESDVGKIVSALQRQNSFRTFKVIDTTQKLQFGYYATHLIVEGRGAGRSQLKCEIQVKTLLQDGWATKTHDLTYKSPAPVSNQVRAMAENIGDMIQSLEKQSDELRTMVVGALNRDRERRASAVKHLMLTQTANYQSDGDAQVAALFQELENNPAHYSQCNEADPQLIAITERWQALDREQQTRGRCRFIMALAAMREEHDLDALALDAVDRFEESSATQEYKARCSALAVRALSHWTLGDLDEAETSGQRLIDLQTAEGQPTGPACLDLAYYLAERLYLSHGDALPEVREKIETLVSAAPPSDDERREMSMLDTRGAILIMTATTIDQVTEGKKLCAAALKWAKDTNTDAALFGLFYDLHSERASRRINELNT